MRSFKITQSITDRQDASLGMFFREVSKIPMIDINKEIELSRRVKSGDLEAANKLVEANLRFVISVAKQYQNKGIPLVDLIQEGTLGLKEAALRYDESKGFRFISYAVWWIRQAIMRAISEQCRTIRVPMNQITGMNKIVKVIDKFEQEYGRKPTIKELEENTNISEDKIDFIINSSNRPVSLETPFKDEEAGCLLDVIPNDNSEETDKELINNSISEELSNIIKKLPNRESDVLRMSFGLGMAPMQNEEIANRFGIGPERVRQIRNEAIERMKSDFINDLKELL